MSDDDSIRLASVEAFLVIFSQCRSDECVHDAGYCATYGNHMELFRKLRGGFNVGDRVRLKDHKMAAFIRSFEKRVYGSVRLSRRLDGFLHWNIRDLVLVRQK